MGGQGLYHPFMQVHITCHHLPSPAITCQHLASPCITWHHLASPGITWLHLASPGVQVMTHLNEEKRRTEGQIHIFDIYQEIENCPASVISSHRRCGTPDH